MSTQRPFPLLTSMIVFALAATSGFAERPVLRGGPPSRPSGMSRGGSTPGVRSEGFRGTRPNASEGSRGILRPGPGVSGHGGFRGTVRALPAGYATFHHGGGSWYCHGGRWYRPWRGIYMGCYPPVGLSLSILPLGFASCWYGGAQYYVYEDVYYMDAPTGGYTVAAPPEVPIEPSVPAQPAPGTPDAAALDALVITPKEGQSAEKMKADRLDAQRFAMRQSAYDPAFSDPNDPGTPRARRAYLKAMKTFLEEHGYTVD